MGISVGGGDIFEDDAVGVAFYFYVDLASMAGCRFCWRVYPLGQNVITGC